MNFITSHHIPSRTKPNITKSIVSTLKLYQQRGFQIQDIHGNNEFDLDLLHESILPSKLHIYAAKEHVGVIEGSIRTVKERCRCITHTVPFKRYTKLMTTSLVECATYWLNAFLSKNGITGNISPAGIVIGCSTPDYKHTNIIFGSYAIVHTGTHNNMKRRSVPGIALGPSNEWGGAILHVLVFQKKTTCLQLDQSANR